jgi:flagellar biosynthesis protein FlhB
MAEQSEDGQEKTEEPTAKKIRESCGRRASIYI